jgi:hypothetical protein
MSAEFFRRYIDILNEDTFNHGINSNFEKQDESAKKPFRQMVDKQQRSLVEKLKNLNVSDAIKEFLIGIHDPDGKVFKAAYYSFPKGSQAQEQLAKEIAAKYGVDADELLDAETKLRGLLLNGGILDQDLEEGKWFRTAYGWAGGSKPDGGKYKHPEQTKADKEAKKKELEKQNPSSDKG